MEARILWLCCFMRLASCCFACSELNAESCRVCRQQMLSCSDR